MVGKETTAEDNAKLMTLEVIKSLILNVADKALSSKQITIEDAGKSRQEESGPDAYVVDTGSANHMVSPKDLTKTSSF